MIANDSTASAPAIELSAGDRSAILKKVLSALDKRFYKPEELDEKWKEEVERHRPIIEAADSADIFEKSMSELLAKLHTSHLGFFHKSARRASSRAALSATYLTDDTEFGKRWIFQDVHAGGAASVAGIAPGDILISVEGQEIFAPEHPVFPMGQKTVVEIVGRGDERRKTIVNVGKPKGKKLQFVQPTLVEGRLLEDGLGYLKIAMFPGMVGVDVANEISYHLYQLKGVERLIIDLRGNTGGGIGALRVMSLLTPAKTAVGFAMPKANIVPDLNLAKERFPRFSSIPTSTKTLWLLALRFVPAMIMRRPIVLETEGLGNRPFHGRITLLVDRHTSSAAEMIVAFAKENGLAQIVGEQTAGKLLSATSVKVGQGFRLALPTGAYYTWKGSVLEGIPIKPDEQIGFDWHRARTGTDDQLRGAIEIANRAHSQPLTDLSR